MFMQLKPVSPYTDSKARCPTCRKLVDCLQLEYVRVGSKHSTRLWHEECETEWRLNLNTMESEVIRSAAMQEGEG